MKKFKGISLPEIIIGLAITSMIAAIAVPSYFDYIVGTKIMDGVLVLGSYKDDLELTYAKYGTINRATIGDSAFHSLPKGTTVNYKAIIDAGNGKSQYINSLTYNYDDDTSILTIDLEFLDSVVRTKNHLYLKCGIKQSLEELHCLCGTDDGANDMAVEYLPQSCDSVQVTTDIAALIAPDDPAPAPVPAP